MKKVIEVRNISKSYLIYHEQQGAYSTLVDTLTRKAKNIFRRIRHPLTSPSQNQFEEFWALKDISFDVEEGDRLGIIGRNGAGKSTLLKILSRITEPTKGSVTIHGRITSLLEVGTGFHQELTGRENIFLNGAILGMSQKEIRSKFDEIVAFAEIERFLDTPVKRFSSGMYTRLGFAIAAHLDPDILIVDEVLAVGDISFQEKCLKKLNSLSNQGRTILFVSHDIGSVLTLCNKGILLENGMIKTMGSADQCVNAYMRDWRQHTLSWQGAAGDEHIRFYRASLSYPSQEQQFLYQQDKTFLHIDYEVMQPTPNLVIGIGIWNQRNQLLGHSHICDDVERYITYITQGRHTLSFQLDAGLFHEGQYTIKLDCFIHGKKEILNDEVSLKFSVYAPTKPTHLKHSKEPSGIYLGNNWKLQGKAK